MILYGTLIAWTLVGWFFAAVFEYCFPDKELDKFFFVLAGPFIWVNHLLDVVPDWWNAFQRWRLDRQKITVVTEKDK